VRFSALQDKIGTATMDLSNILGTEPVVDAEEGV
jgi:hypothetical protein